MLALTSSAQERNTNTQNSAAVSFIKDIAPILLAKCQTCHNPEKTKGGFQLHTFEALLKGGESKEPSITPGQPKQSKLFELVTTKDPDDRMPQKDDPLAVEQIALIERWIKEGARFDGADPKATLVTLIPRMPHPAPPSVYSRPVPVNALAFNPDGQELAAGGYHEITIWSVTSGQLLCRIKDVPQRTQCLAYNPDGSLLAAAGGTPGQTGEVALFDPVKGSLVKVLGRASDTMLVVGFSVDGTRLAAGGADNSLHVYEVASGKEQLLIQQHADWVMGLAFSHDGDHLASASRDRTARIYDSRTGELEATYTEHAAPVFAIAFSHDGKQILSAGRDKKIHLWNPKDGKKAGEIGGFEEEIFKLVLNENDVFSCAADKQVRQHALADKKLTRTFAGHADMVYSLALHPATKRLAAGSYDGSVRVWNVESGELVVGFQAAPGLVAGK